ncbi:hypothetical protein [Aliiroseovarius sp.]|uniref:hypothetical protein n=1 Tax=Aliiroseovarius sp. TaxID=1872442 RepID=UPI003BAA6866
MTDQTFIPRQIDLAQRGVGSDWMDVEQTTQFAEAAFALGFGVQFMEAHGTGASRGKHKLSHQMLGTDDDGKNWDDHKDPERALTLVRRKAGLR